MLEACPGASRGASLSMVGLSTNLSARAAVEGLGERARHGQLPLDWKRLGCRLGIAAWHLSLPAADCARFSLWHYRWQSHRPLLWSLGLRSLDPLWGIRPRFLDPWIYRLLDGSVGSA